MQIHVSNLHSNLIESDLVRLFAKYGEVEGLQLVRDKLNNRSLGHAYVEMPVPKDAQMAILGLNDTEVKGKKIKVKEVMYDPALNASWNVSKNV